MPRAGTKISRKDSHESDQAARPDLSIFTGGPITTLAEKSGKTPARGKKGAARGDSD